jgi:formylglycine-generating enzyme required for sulfatase activity
MVVVKNFYLDVYEVTCREYKAFVEATNRNPPPTWKNGNYPPGTDRYPVTGVSWEDADAYARWAGKRLPTEEEWEFAARGKEGLRYPWGNSWKNECANADNVQRGITNVGSYKCASPFGIQDLIGNAWEWTATPWMPYPGGHLTNPPQASEKVIRGGSWESPRAYISTTVRSGWRGIGDQTGFRCAMDIQ